MSLFKRQSGEKSGNKPREKPGNVTPRETTDEWELYEKGVEYNRKLNLYDMVDECEAYYAGDQWRGVDAGGLPTPVFNIFKRVLNYFIASILSSPVKMRYAPDGIPNVENPDGEAVWHQAELLQQYANYRWEKDKMDAVMADALRDAGITGDAVAYVWWDASVKTGQFFEGDFRTRLIDCVNIHFGDPGSSDIQTQPYILLVGRELITALQKEARENGGEEEKITADEEDRQNQAGDMAEYELEGSKATTVTKFWREEDGSIWWCKSTRQAVIRKAVQTPLRQYPFAAMNWDKRKNSWHGRGIVEGLIQNQRYINKSYALMMKHMMDTSFSKIVYDATRIDLWNQEIGEAIPVQGNVAGAASTVGVGSMQSGFLDAVTMAESKTRDLMGASDAALGNVKPENTSAILALQQSAAVPLENVKRNLYQFVEDIGLIWLDYMIHYYDSARRLPVITDGVGQSVNPLTMQDSRTVMQTSGQRISAAPMGEVNPETIWDCRVDVGPSVYWSELACLQTLDNLLQMHAIDLVQYLERVPDTVIPEKRELIREIQARQQMAVQQAAGQQMVAVPASEPGGVQSGGSTAAAPDPAEVLAMLPEDLRGRLEALPEDLRQQALAEIMSN